MIFNLWFVIIGAILIFMALAATTLKRLPLSTSLVYLAIGFALGPTGFALINLDPLDNSLLLERLTEVAVLISLFSAGLKIRTPLRDRRWRIPLRLATASMMVTVFLIAVVGNVWLGLPLGAAILLGAVLAPTDPVLASDVQVKNPEDGDRLRFSLTGEAGMNDGTAFPFVMLGLGLLGLHEIGRGGTRWLAVDVLWATIGGVAIGWILGLLVGRLIIYLRSQNQDSLQMDDFLALGLIALSYGLALLLYTYGFLAVFAAGLALRRAALIAEENGNGKAAPAEKLAAESSEDEEVGAEPQQTPAYMAKAVLGFSEALERIGEVGLVLLLGGMLSSRYVAWEALWFIPLLFLVIRPISVFLGTFGAKITRPQRRLMSWFGVRGIGSIYYLMYAIEHGLPESLAQPIISLVFPVIAVSVVVHGISVTPLMEMYSRRFEKSAASALP